VDLVQIDVIGTQTAQAVLQSGHQVVARSPPVVDAFSHGALAFGGQYDLIPAVLNGAADIEL